METTAQQQIKQCFLFLRQNNNENIQFASKWLDEFYSQPISVYSLILFYQSSEDQADRFHAAVALSTSIQRNWPKYNAETREKLFISLLNLLVRESVWVVRTNLINAVQLAMVNELGPLLFQFIVQAAANGSDSYLEIALLLGPLVVGASEQIEDIIPTILEVQLAAFEFMVYFTNFPQYQQSLEKYQQYQMIVLGLLDKTFDDNHMALCRIKNLIVYAFDINQIPKNPLIFIQKCLSFFQLPNPNVDSLMIIYEIIQCICHNFPNEILETNLFLPIVQVSFYLSTRIYNRTDSYSLSNADFFVPVISDLCKSHLVLNELWNICTQISATEQGKLFSCFCFSTTCKIFPEFYYDKLPQFTELLCICLTGSSLLLCEVSARVTKRFIKCFGSQSEYTDSIITALFRSFSCHLNSDLLLIFARLLDLTKNSDYIFDEAYAFLINVLTNIRNFELQSSALTCLASLSSSSTLKIAVYFQQLYQVLKEILLSQNESNAQLKSFAIVCLSHASTNLGEIFEPHVIEVSEFCIKNLNNSNDISLAISCYSSLELIIQKYPLTFKPLNNIILPILCEAASINYNQLYRSTIAKSIDMLELGTDASQLFDFDADNVPQFIASSLALRILSILVKNNVGELVHKYTMYIMNCCEMQKDSVSYVCKSATCFAIGNLAESLVNHHFGSFAAIPDQMGSILVDIIPNKVSDKNDRRIAIDAFDAAKKLVEWLDYDSLPNTLRPLLEIAYKYLAKIYEKNENETFSKELVENVYSFINMTIMSAEKESPQLLQNFLPLFMKYSEKPPFRSIAARFFGDMISVGSHFLDEPFKVNVMNFALELADKENDTYSFSCIKDMILKEKEITLRFGQKICELCLAKLMIPVVKTEKFLLMRDNCIVTFVAYIMNIGTESINLDIVLPNILNALPLVIDYSENLMIADFLIWTFNLENGKFAEFILRPLIIIFANPPSIIARFQFSEQNQIEMFKILYFLLSNQSDPKQIIGSVLEDDELRANYLQSNVESMRQRYSSA